MDIFFTNGAQLPEMKKTNPSYYNCLLKQRDDGTFEDVTAKAGLLGQNLDFNFGVAVGDYDNDGYEDLFICSAGRNVLYHNNGDGTFTDVTEASGITKPPDTLSVVAAWFDYDNDGLLDLIVDNYTYWTPQTDVRCTMDGAEFYCDPRRYKSVPPRLYHNLGHGKFEDVTEESRDWRKRRAKAWVSPSRILMMTDGRTCSSPTTRNPIRSSSTMATALLKKRAGIRCRLRR